MSELKAFYMPRYAGEFTTHEVYLKSEADKVIAEKDMEIFNLKEELSYIKADSTFDRDKYKKLLKSKDEEIRRLKRALWLARAERAKEMCRRLLIQGFDPKWEEIERKCRAKAEEYK